MGALLELEDVRIDEAGLPALDGVRFATTGDAVVTIGAPRALFEAAAGMRKAAQGRVLVDGVPAARAVEERLVAGAPLDPPLPPAWTTRRYLEESAALVGLRGHERGRRVTEAIAGLKLEAVADAPIAKAVLHARRAIVIAAAMATGAKILFLDDPLAGLPDDVARNFGKIVAAALEGRPWIVFAGRLPLASPLCTAADEALVFAGGAVVGQGAPAELAIREGSFVVRIAGDAKAFGERLASRDVKATPTGDTIAVDLPEGATTHAVFAAAEESGAVILELRPVARGFV